jgi:hypothetical protein
MNDIDEQERLTPGPVGTPFGGSGGQTPLGELKMSRTERDYTQPLGLDVGTSRIVVARTTDKRYQYDVELNAFLTLPYSRLAESLLQRENVFHEVQGAEIVVAGNDAQRFAEVFHVETRRPMQSGVLNPHEPHSLAVVRRIISKVAGKAQVDGQKIFFSVPSPGAEGEGGIAFHEASIRQVLTELGYGPTSIEEGLAVVFGELGGSNYTGIGISCGSGLCNVCFSVLSVPVISFSVPKAGDFIDAQAALVTGDVATRLRVHKEQSFHLNGLGSDRVQNALTVYYQEMIQDLVEAMRDHISAAGRLPKLDQAIPLVVCGGTAAPQGFLEQFGRALRALDFPVRLSELRVSSDPLNSTARGCLMAALC